MNFIKPTYDYKNGMPYCDGFVSISEYGFLNVIVHPEKNKSKKDYQIKGKVKDLEKIYETIYNENVKGDGSVIGLDLWVIRWVNNDKYNGKSNTVLKYC